MEQSTKGIKGIWTRHKRLIRTVAGLALAAAAFYLLIFTGEEGGEGAISLEKLKLILQHPGWVMLGILMVFLANTIAVPRWMILLRAQKIHMPFGEAFRLAYLGYFFNLVVPGGTGGDVVKAYYATKYTDKKAEAVTTVFLDRVIGLYALSALAAAAILVNFNTLWNAQAKILPVCGMELNQAQALVVVTLALFVSGSIAFFVLFSGVLAKSATLVAIAKRMPFHNVIRKVHYALVIYKDHKFSVFVVFLMSAILQSCSVIAHWFFSRSLGATSGEMNLASFFFLVPIGLVINAIPIAPMGLGVGEGAFHLLFGLFKFAKGAMLVLLFHLAQFLTSLVGLAYFIAGKSEYRKIIEEAEDGGFEDVK